MKGALLFLVAFVVAATSAENSCIASVDKACLQNVETKVNSDFECNAHLGRFNEFISPMLQGFANVNLKNSYDYLLISSHFKNYKKARPGFQKVFKDLSDKLWEDTIGLIKHITKRGGRMDWNNVVNGHGINHARQPTLELDEISAMAYALDTEKKLADLTHYIHSEASKNRHYDPEITQYLEEEFMEKQAEGIRKLSGHANDLKHLYTDQPDNSLGTYLFDEYLTKL